MGFTFDFVNGGSLVSRGQPKSNRPWHWSRSQKRMRWWLPD